MTDKFKMEKLLGRMVVDGDVPGRGKVKKGTVLYKVLWEGYPPEIATWEDESQIHDDFIDAYEAELAAEAELDAEADLEVGESSGEEDGSSDGSDPDGD